MTSALLKSINTKNQLYNTLRRSIKEAKRLYYTRTFAIYKNNIKQTWTIIKDTLQRKLKCETPSQFVIGNRTLLKPTLRAKLQKHKHLQIIWTNAIVWKYNWFQHRCGTVKHYCSGKLCVKIFWYGDIN